LEAIAARRERIWAETSKQLDGSVGKFATMPEEQRVKLSSGVMARYMFMGMMAAMVRPIEEVFPKGASVPGVGPVPPFERRSDPEYNALKVLGNLLIEGPEGMAAKEYNSKVTKAWTDAKKAAAEKVEEHKRLLESTRIGQKKR
jgi:hypothetical protein